MPLIESDENLNLKLLINTRRDLLLAIALILGGVMMLAFAVKPQITALWESKDALSNQRQYFEKLTQKLNDLKQIKVSEEFKKKDKVDEVLPSHKPVLELLTNLSQASSQNNINITELEIAPGEISTDSTETTTQVSKTNSNKNYSQLKLTMVAKGKRDDVDAFMEIAERIAPFTSIVELELKETRNRSEVQTESGSESTQADITFETYYYTGSIKTKVDTQLPSVGDAEMRVFDTIQQFRPTGFKPPSEIKSTDIEDLFGIEGFEFNLNAD
jgi:Tfp pilus assembly protein PilO